MTSMGVMLTLPLTHLRQGESASLGTARRPSHVRLAAQRRERSLLQTRLRAADAET